MILRGAGAPPPCSDVDAQAQRRAHTSSIKASPGSGGETTIPRSLVRGPLVDMDPIQTQATGSDKHVEITWNITSPGWIFDKNKGIDIQNKRNWVPKWVSDIQYTARNKEKDGVTYKYTINVTDGKTPLAWDPTIMN
jgi:hypothetical protein